jgi:tetrahydromethanopterin S-methyltransferase subunit G
MTEETTNLVLEQLRHIRHRMDRLDEKVDTVILRLGIIEGHVANFHVSEAGQNLEIDRIRGRLDRIEQRLELTDG